MVFQKHNSWSFWDFDRDRSVDSFLSIEETISSFNAFLVLKLYVANALVIIDWAKDKNFSASNSDPQNDYFNKHFLDWFMNRIGIGIVIVSWWDVMNRKWGAVRSVSLLCVHEGDLLVKNGGNVVNLDSCLRMCSSSGRRWTEWNAAVFKKQFKLWQIIKTEEFNFVEFENTEKRHQTRFSDNWNVSSAKTVTKKSTAMETVTEMSDRFDFAKDRMTQMNQLRAMQAKSEGEIWMIGW